MAIAHPDFVSGKHQTLSDHLNQVGNLAGRFAQKVDLKDVGMLMGLLHDLGKYSKTFQDYMDLIIREKDVAYDPDSDEVSSKSLKGKIDHSTAGAQWVWNQLYGLVKSSFPIRPKIDQLLAVASVQILALCIACHHGGLMDNLESENGAGFKARLAKDDGKTHYSEVLENADREVLSLIHTKANQNLLESLVGQLKKWAGPDEHRFRETKSAFNLGMGTKFLFSCLIDADRIDSADFEDPHNAELRHRKPEWDLACERLESFMQLFPVSSPIDGIRREISETCYQRAGDPTGIFSLTVPTGGGKTYSSLRFALHHAKVHKLDMIIYVIPYTSIIEQNSDAIRKVVESEGEPGTWVLEHHSNLEPELMTWRSKLVAENWDAPIVFTTMVQFLETLFAGGTRGVRRLHQLAKSVLIFDEIQTLPINCVHLFNNAINFLTEHCGTSAVMCTATQPLLNRVDEKRGRLNLASEREIMPNVPTLFGELKRVEIVDRTKQNGWSVSEIAALAKEEVREKGSCLVVVNTKQWAQDLYREIIENSELPGDSLFHLSTSMCPAHRKEVLGQIKDKLKNDEQVVCISTQLIEAGVDIDFASVIRFLAGLDSIAQAAGRCNRSGKRSTGSVFVVNPDRESVGSLKDIATGQEQTRRILGEFQGQDFLLPEVMERYYQYYFFDRQQEMVYATTSKSSGPNNLLNLLSSNKNNPRANHKLPLHHAFKTAGLAFKAIDAPTQSLIVPYGEGKELITRLSSLEFEKGTAVFYGLLRQAQQYSVNLFSTAWDRLKEQGAIIEAAAETGVYYLNEQYYNNDFGVCTEKCSDQNFYNA